MLTTLQELDAMRAPVWNPTGRACARWFTTAYPASAALRLEPSTWQDFPGSLS